MNLHKQILEDLTLSGKRVIIRADFNVPLDDSLQITDDTRIRSTLTHDQPRRRRRSQGYSLFSSGSSQWEVRPEIQPGSDRQAPPTPARQGGDFRP